MSNLKFPNKDKDDTLDYSVDWSRFLGTNTISQVLWFVKNENGVKTRINAGDTINNITSTSQLISTNGKVAIICVSGRTNNLTYSFTCSITDSRGLSTERSINITIKER